MPRSCSICSHPMRREIDTALVSGTGLRKIAERFSDTSVTALFRHKTHVSTNIVKAREAQEVARADSLLASVVALRERLEKALDDAVAPKDVASLARETRETLKLLLELEGRLRKGAQVQVAVQTNVAVADEAEPKGNLLDGFLRKVYDVLVKSGAAGRLEWDPANEPPALEPGTTIPEAASAEAVATPIIHDATQEALLKEWRAGAKKLGASIRYPRFAYNGRIVEGPAGWDEFIDTADVTALRFLYQNFGAALPEWMVEPLAPAPDRAALVSQAVSLHRQLGFARIVTRKHTIPFGEGESRKFFEAYDVESLLYYVEFLESLVRAKGTD